MAMGDGTGDGLDLTAMGKTTEGKIQEVMGGRA